jgi:type II secretory pathway pseudopilin PulG
MTTNPYDSPHELCDAPEKKPVRWMPRLIEVLAVVGVTAMLVALLLPARRGGREAARYMQCNNNLRQIALALQNYVDVNGALPPAYTVDADGKPLHSWRTLILPYMEQNKLFDMIDLSKPWDDPVNKSAFETHVPTYDCPSATSPPTHTTYFALVGPDRCFDPTEPRKLAEITDDHGLTLMIVEGPAKAAVHWMSPLDAADEVLFHPTAGDPLPHPIGVNASAVDGHVLLIGEKMSLEKRCALASIAGGDDAIAGEEN